MHAFIWVRWWRWYRLTPRFNQTLAALCLLAFACKASAQVTYGVAPAYSSDTSSVTYGVAPTEKSIMLSSVRRLEMDTSRSALPRQKLIELTREANKLQSNLKQSTVAKIAQDLQRVAGAIDCRDYAEAVQGIESVSRLFGPADAHQLWIRQQLSEGVLSVDDVRTIISIPLNRLHAQWCELDCFLLEAAGVKQSSIPEYKQLRIDLTNFEYSFSTAVELGRSASRAKPADFIATELIGQYFAEITQSSALSTKSQGKRNWQEELANEGLGVAVGMATDAALTAALDTEGALNRSVTQTLRKGLLDLRPDANPTPAWKEWLDRATATWEQSRMSNLAEAMNMRVSELEEVTREVK